MCVYVYEIMHVCVCVFVHAHTRSICVKNTSVHLKITSQQCLFSVPGEESGICTETADFLAENLSFQPLIRLFGLNESPGVRAVCVSALGGVLRGEAERVCLSGLSHGSSCGRWLWGCQTRTSPALLN